MGTWSSWRLREFGRSISLAHNFGFQPDGFANLSHGLFGLGAGPLSAFSENVFDIVRFLCQLLASLSSRLELSVDLLQERLFSHGIAHAAGAITFGHGRSLRFGRE